jgi:hypothetical protein
MMSELQNGKCVLCNELFVGMRECELEKRASRHIWDEHRDHDNHDEQIVVRIG